MLFFDTGERLIDKISSNDIYHTWEVATTESFENYHDLFFLDLLVVD